MKFSTPLFFHIADALLRFILLFEDQMKYIQATHIQAHFSNREILYLNQAK